VRPRHPDGPRGLGYGRECSSGGRRAPDGVRGLATAGIVVNGVLLALAAVGLCIFGLAFVGTLWTRTLPTPRPSVAATRSPAHEVPRPPSPRATNGMVQPTPPLLTTTAVLGESAKVGELRLAVLAYSETDKCPEGGGRPAQAAKFVMVQASAGNDGADVIDLPRIHWTLDSYEAGLGAGLSCRYNRRAFGSACWASGGRLFPGRSARDGSSSKSPKAWPWNPRRSGPR